MKQIITILLIIAPFLIFSQEKDVSEFKKSKLNSIKLLNEILDKFPADAQILSFEMTSGNGTKANIIAGNNAEMDEKKISFLNAIKPGSFVYIDLKSKDSIGRIIAYTYKIKIID